MVVLSFAFDLTSRGAKQKYSVLTCESAANPVRTIDSTDLRHTLQLHAYPRNKKMQPNYSNNSTKLYEKEPDTTQLDKDHYRLTKSTCLGAFLSSRLPRQSGGRTSVPTEKLLAFGSANTARNFGSD